MLTCSHFSSDGLRAADTVEALQFGLVDGIWLDVSEGERGVSGSEGLGELPGVGDSPQ